MGEGYSKAHWAKDETAITCRHCNAAFSLIRRRHHCRNCGYIFCQSCTFRTQPLPNRQIFHEVRVCDDCYYALLESGTTQHAQNVAKSESRFVEGPGQQNAAAPTATSNGSGDKALPTAAALPQASASTTEQQVPAQQQPPHPTPAKSQEQLLQERLKVVMQNIHQESIYLEADAVVVESVNADEEPLWSDQQDYQLHFVPADSCVIPFPPGQQENTAQLLLEPIHPPTSASTDLWNDDAKKKFMSMIAPYVVA